MYATKARNTKWFAQVMLSSNLFNKTESNNMEQSLFVNVLITTILLEFW